MKKFIISFLVILSLTSTSSFAQTDSIAKSFDIAPEIIEKLDANQLLELAVECLF